MLQDDSRIAALVEDAVSLGEDLLNALHAFTEVAEEDERTHTMVLAWKNSIRAQRDLVRGEISRQTRSPRMVAT